MALMIICKINYGDIIYGHALLQQITTNKANSLENVLITHLGPAVFRARRGELLGTAVGSGDRGDPGTGGTRRLQGGRAVRGYGTHPHHTGTARGNDIENPSEYSGLNR